jgi:TatD DNase family protein
MEQLNLFDTHAHVNFKRFSGREDEVINEANNAGITYIVIPGTDIKSSKKAIKLAQRYALRDARFANVYAAVGIHPHHVFSYIQTQNSPNPLRRLHKDLMTIEEMLNQVQQDRIGKIVVAVGEVGLDKHAYKRTKYLNYRANDQLLKLQKKAFIAQLHLAVKHHKSLIIHNREAAEELLEVLNDNWDQNLAGRTVLHCCEPNEQLLQFAKEKHIFIGVDGDAMYDKEKQEFIKKVPLDILVLETDSPYLLPEPLKSQKAYPNEPKNLPIIAAFIAQLKDVTAPDLGKITTANAGKLFEVQTYSTS